MPLTVTSAANAIREAYAPGFNEAVFRNDGSFLSLFNWTPADGDTAFRWKLNTAGNDSVQIFTEGLAQPDAGEQAYVNAAVSWTYFRGMAQVTGHARDALKSAWFAAVDEEFTLLRSDLVDLITTSMMGGTYGVELAVDYGSSYAGITRNGSASYFESTETAVNAAVSTADLQDLEETIEDNEKGGKPSILVVPRNQLTRIYNLAGPHVIYNSQVTDKVPGMSSQTFNGKPIVAFPDWTDTVIAMLDMRPQNWAPKVIRPFSVKEMAPSGDSDIWQLSFGCALVCKMPKLQGKLTGCTA